MALVKSAQTKHHIDVSSTMRKIYFAVVLIALALGVGCSSVLLQQKEIDKMVHVRVETDKSTYDLGEEVQINITLVNDQGVEVSLSSLSYGLEISGPQGVVFLMNVHQTSQGPVRIEPFSQRFVGSYTWNQEDINKSQVPSGTYTIRVCLLDSTNCGTTTIKIQ